MRQSVEESRSNKHWYEKASKNHGVTGTVQERRKKDERSATINFVTAACVQVSGLFKREKKRRMRTRRNALMKNDKEYEKRRSLAR